MAVRSTLRVLPLWMVLVDFWSNFANAHLTFHPKDAVVLVNQPTYFNCSTSARNINANYVLWYHYPLNSATRNYVYDEGQIMSEYKDRFRIEANLSTGVFNLVVERPSLADAGRYECQDRLGQGDKASAELIILALNAVESSTVARVTREIFEKPSSTDGSLNAVESSTVARVTREIFEKPSSTDGSLDKGESSAVTRFTREDLQKESSTDWYFISLSLVAALFLFFVVTIVLVAALCFRFKKKLSAKYKSAALGKVEMPIRDGDYDIIPYATSDNYETIDGVVIDAHLEFSFPPRQGPLPTPGYSGLTQTEPTAPGVYSRIDTYETPEDITLLSRDTMVLATMETTSEKQVDDSKEKKDGEGEGNQIRVQPYLELFDADNPETISEKHVGDSKKNVNGKEEVDSQQSPVHPYIDLFDVAVGDNPDECNTTSDCDIPSSYLTVNF